MNGDGYVTYEERGDAMVVRIGGEIDHHGAKRTLQGIADKIDQYMPMVCVLDFKNVVFMDSSGIAVIIHTYRRMKELGGVLRLRQVSVQPWKVLHAAGIDRIVNTERREEHVV